MFGSLRLHWATANDVGVHGQTWPFRLYHKTLEHERDYTHQHPFFIYFLAWPYGQHC
jgi:hypothetical protein